MEYKNVSIEKIDKVVTITINRPPVNAMNMDAYIEITDIFNKINLEDDVKSVIITGTGKHFIAGSDVNEFKDLSPEQSLKRNPIIFQAFKSVYDCQVPVIAAINGTTLGGGIGIMASCDIIIIAEESTFGLPEINVGKMGGASHLQRVVPHMKARTMMLTGQRISAMELYNYGSIEKIVPRSKVLQVATEYAKEIVEKSPVAIRIAKESLNSIEYMDLLPAYEHEQSMTSKLVKYEDSKEAVMAFLEKRKPVFKGK